MTATDRAHLALVRAPRVVLDPAHPGQSVRSATRRSDSPAPTRQRARGPWQPPEGVSPEDARRVIAAGRCERDRLAMRVLWATAGRASETVALRPRDVERDALVLGNRKNPERPTKRVFLSAADQDLPGALLVWARFNDLRDDEPLFFSRKRAVDGGRKAISRVQLWHLVKEASRRAGVQVLALRASADGAAGEPAPIHPHIFRHASIRHIVRQTRSLPLAQKQAGWSRLQLAYLTVGEAEARAMMAQVTE